MKVIENPVLDSPFKGSTRHSGHPDEDVANQAVEDRQTDSCFVPISTPKKKALNSPSPRTERRAGLESVSIVIGLPRGRMHSVERNALGGPISFKHRSSGFRAYVARAETMKVGTRSEYDQ